jgi:hypothetical protein
MAPKLQPPLQMKKCQRKKYIEEMKKKNENVEIKESNDLPEIY